MATQPTQVTQYQTGIAPELAPYMQNLLGQQAARMYTYEKDASGQPVMVGPEGQPLTKNEQGQYVDSAGTVINAASPKISGFQQFQAYGDRTAGFQDLQNRAFGAAQNLGYDPTTQTAASGIQSLAQQAGQTSYSPLQAAYNEVNGPNLQQYQMGPAERVRTQSFAQPGAAASYMNPYIQDVVSAQQREARRASSIAGQAEQAQAVGRGAFGGSRDALMRAERQRNLATQLGDIQATGLNSAYQQAQQQFNAEQNARLTAQQANQQAGLTSSIQNLNALLGVQQLGSGQNLQAQLANQQAGLTAQQLQEQSRQYGAGLGLQGLQAGMSGYGQLAGVGQNLYNQNIGNITLQSQLGTQQQQQEQNKINTQYQDWLSKQNYPQQQMDVMASYIRGTPLSTQSASTYAAPPSTLSQVVGLGTAGVGAYGMYNAMNPQQRAPGTKKGGVIKEKKRTEAGGLEALALSKLG